MWQDRMVTYSERIARRFNNPKVFQTITVRNPEFREPIIYTPIRQYCRERFVAHMEQIGVSRISAMFRRQMRGSTTDFFSETRTLAFLIGLREMGLPLVLNIAPRNRPNEARRYFERGGVRYIRNFSGSGLDYVNRNGTRQRVRSYLRGSSRIFVDDPDSNDPLDIGIRQQEIHTVYAAYFRYQYDLHLSTNLLNVNSRLMRFFWRALTFGGPGGSAWPSSRFGGRNSLLTLSRLLSVGPGRISELWRPQFVSSRVDRIRDINILRSLARESRPNRNSDIVYWQGRAKEEIGLGLGRPRYFQAMKTAAIAEAFMTCDWDGTGIPLNPF